MQKLNKVLPATALTVIDLMNTKMKLILANDLKSRLMADFGVTSSEIEECFMNRVTSFEQSIQNTAPSIQNTAPSISDTPQSISNTPQSISDTPQSNLIDATAKNFSFVSKTDRGRQLKIEFNIKEKLLHVLQLPDRAVTMEQEGVFCEVTAVESITRMKQTSNS